MHVQGSRVWHDHYSAVADPRGGSLPLELSGAPSSIRGRCGSRGRWVRRPPLGRRDPRRRRGFLRLKSRKVVLEWLFNTIQALYGNNILKSCKFCVCVRQKSLIPISYKVINPLAPSPGRNPGSAPEGHHRPIRGTTTQVYQGYFRPINKASPTYLGTTDLAGASPVCQVHH